MTRKLVRRGSVQVSRRTIWLASCRDVLLSHPWQDSRVKWWYSGDNEFPSHIVSWIVYGTSNTGCDNSTTAYEPLRLSFFLIQCSGIQQPAVLCLQLSEERRTVDFHANDSSRYIFILK